MGSRFLEVARPMSNKRRVLFKRIVHNLLDNPKDLPKYDIHVNIVGVYIYNPKIDYIEERHDIRGYDSVLNSWYGKGVVNHKFYASYDLDPRISKYVAMSSGIVVAWIEDIQDTRATIESDFCAQFLQKERGINDV